MFDILELSDADRYAIWNEGISKQYAYVNYCNEDIKSRFITMREAARVADRRQMKNMVTTGKKLKDAGVKNYLKEIPFEEQADKVEFEKYENELKTHMIKAIKQGVFIVLGYEYPRQMSDAPKPVPLDVWDQYDPWHGDNFKLGTSKITDVRVTLKSSVASYFKPQQDIPQESPIPPVPATSSSPIEAKQAGRKSRKGEILSAFEILSSENRLTKDTPTQVLAHEIREYILNQTSLENRSITGLSDETIRRVIRST